MKRLETIFISLYIVSLLLRAMSVQWSDQLTIVAGCGLAILYLPFSFVFFNEIPARSVLKVREMASSWDVVKSVLLGFLLTFSLFFVTANVLQFQPNLPIWLSGTFASLGLSIVCYLITFFSDKVLYKNILLRSVVLLLIVIG